MQQRLVKLVMKRLTDRNNRIRAEDTVCAAAAIIGERCIDAAGDYPLRDHDIHPGKRVFSDRANELLSGDIPDVTFTPDSIFGLLKAGVNSSTYTEKDFPDVSTVFRGYAAGIGKSEDWGKVPVTVLPAHHPVIIPLQFAFETREKVDAIFKPIAQDKMRCLRIAVGALADLLNQMAGAIPADVALRLAFEIINGMAKTAPMTRKAFLAAQKAPAAR